MKNGFQGLRGMALAVMVTLMSACGSDHAFHLMILALAQREVHDMRIHRNAIQCRNLTSFVV